MSDKRSQIMYRSKRVLGVVVEIVKAVVFVN